MKVTLKDVLIFCGGFGAGATAGAIVAKEVVKRKMEKDHEEEIAELRELYTGNVKKPESLTKKEETDVETVGEGIPKEKKVNTKETDYTKCYKKAGDKHVLTDEQKARIKAVQSQAPSEDDDRESGIYEITKDYDYENDEPGFGDKKFQDWIEMTFYTYDETLAISSWGSYEEAELERTPEQIVNDESELVHDILPVLQEMEFLNKPYDIMYIRNNLRGVDVKVTKAYSQSPITT
jgi:hypothetical protein